jgi:hypothetical protein
LEPDDPAAQEEGRQREEQRGLWRQGHAGPVLAEPKAWLDKQYGQVLPKSVLAQTAGHALNHGAALCRYQEQG